jgi:ubiquinone biosynthesis protein COQ4
MGGSGPDDSLREQDAVRVALAGSVAERLSLAGRSLGRLMRSPGDTRQVFLLYVTLNAPSAPRITRAVLGDPEGRRMFEARAAIDSRSVDLEALARLPEGTLGRAYADHLRRNGLDPDLFQAPPGVPADVAWVAQRLRQSHDVWHVVTGYDTSVADELCLQAFTFAQVRAAGPAVLSAIGTLRWMWRDPRLVARVADGLRRGAWARSLLTVPWEERWGQELDALRRELRVAPALA